MRFEKNFNKMNESLINHQWNPEVIEYYFYKVMRNISFALISIFIPIFLYSQVGYSLFEIMLFFLINEFLFLISIPFSGKIIEKLGIKHSILLHLPGMAIFTFGMRYLTGDFMSDIWLILFLLVVRVVPKATMGSSEQIFITRNILNKKDKDGSGLASIRILLIMASLISPLIGGFITYFFGFEAFFNVAILFMVLASIPLLLTKDEYFHTKLNSKDIVKFVFKSVPKNFHMAEGSKWAVDSLLWIVWPLFLFIVIKNTLSLGFLVSVSAMVSIIVSYFVGKYIDSKSPKKLLSKMTKISASIFFLRSVFPSQISILIFDSINKIIEPVLMLPYEKYYFSYIKSNADILKITIASLMIMEIYYFLSLVFLTCYFGIIQYLNINITYLTFVFLFLIYGFLILFMNKISELELGNNSLKLLR